MDQCILRAPTQEDWPHIAELFAKSVPNALASSLGPCFGAYYYRHMGEGPKTASFAAFDEAGTLAGVVIGTLARKHISHPPLLLKLRLLVAANIRLLSPAFLNWLANTRHTTKRADAADNNQPQAELLMIAIAPRFRGQHLASRLLSQLEEFFRNHGLNTPYIIHTEQSNHAANTFYEQIGALFVGTNLYHNRQINEWHKTVTQT